MNRRQFLTAIGLGPLAPHLDKLAGMLPKPKTHNRETSETIKLPVMSGFDMVQHSNTTGWVRVDFYTYQWTE